MSPPRDARPTLDRLVPGDVGRVIDVGGQGAFRRRLLDMGFVAGADVRVIKEAPLNDPVEYRLGGTHVTLRRHEAAHIVVEPCPPHGRGGPRPAAHGRGHGAGRLRRRFGRFGL
jgi:ferrous iron transport protein A